MERPAYASPHASSTRWSIAARIVRFARFAQIVRIARFALARGVGRRAFEGRIRRFVRRRGLFSSIGRLTLCRIVLRVRALLEDEDVLVPQEFAIRGEPKAEGAKLGFRLRARHAMERPDRHARILAAVLDEDEPPILR